MNLSDGQYAAYLRKSRADIEAEGRGEEDTYAKHRNIIFDMAKRLGIIVSRVYQEEPISGERISERPEMLKLLEDVEKELWAGILVVEVERLARGDTMDQGLVAQTFKYSNTLIITPMRIYDPNNSDDEEYFEFGLFMSRREFKTINRRQQRGRVESVKEGKFVGNRPPYGYNRVKLDGRKGFTLRPNSDQAPVVKMIFELYTQKDMGMSLIAQHLNSLGIPSGTGGKWRGETINGIIRNVHYAGKVRWGFRSVQKKRTGKSRPRKSDDECIVAEGIHDPLVDEVTFRRAQDILRKRGHAPAPQGKINNPLASLLRCGVCNNAMVMRPYTTKSTKPTLMCITTGCPNVSAFLYLVEDRVLAMLKEWLKNYKSHWKNHKPAGRRDDQTAVRSLEAIVKRQRRNLEELEEQKGNLHDLVERKVYSVDEFMDRSQILAKRIEEAKKLILESEQQLETERQRIQAKVEFIPKVEEILEVYPKIKDPAQRNRLLKLVLDEIVYVREKGGRWNGPMDNFKLKIVPKMVES